MRYKKYWKPYVEALDQRMKKGYRRYGDINFDKPAKFTVEQIQEELVDIVGWGLILWGQLEEIKKRLNEEPISEGSFLIPFRWTHLYEQIRGKSHVGRVKKKLRKLKNGT